MAEINPEDGGPGSEANYLLPDTAEIGGPRAGNGYR
jgi:hypothetical protein